MGSEARKVWRVVTLGVVLVVGCFFAGYFLARKGEEEKPGSVAVGEKGVAEGRVMAPEVVAQEPRLVGRPMVEVREPVPPPAPVRPVKPLEITKAVYGDLPAGASKDVTDMVASIAGNSFLNVAAVNDIFSDPAPGIVKKLRVEYLQYGVLRARVVEENETLSIRIAPGRPKLVIRRAQYGDVSNGRVVDVMGQVLEVVGDDTLTIGANNENFGDPAVGITKSLRVEFTRDGREGIAMASEGETLKIER